MFKIPQKKDAIHKAWLYRVLEAIADDAYLVNVLYFKGGTCASMLDWLDRFSIDLDFDYIGKNSDIKLTRSKLEDLWKNLGLTVKDFSKNGIQYFLGYNNPNQGERNTLKVEATFPAFKSSEYKPQRFVEIDRIFTCQTKETMFAHKLVAPLDRFLKTGKVAGRDIYDIHHFFLKGFEYNNKVIEERTKLSIEMFFIKLADFIEKEVTDSIIIEDLGSLLSHEDFHRIRKVLKREVLGMIREHSNIGNNQ